MLRDVRLRRRTSRIEVVADRDNLRSERAHAGDLARVRVDRNEHDGRDPERTCGIRDALPEIARRRAHHRPIRGDPPLPRQRGHRRPGSAALEGADRVGRLDLHDDRYPRRRDRPSWMYCGEWLKTGSIPACAARIAAGSRSGMEITGGATPGFAWHKEKRPKEPLVRSQLR